MDKIKVDLHNCFGIQEMQHEFDFHGDNVIAIYARNGLMKISFAKTFQKIQSNKADEIRDAIFGDIANITVKIAAASVGAELTSTGRHAPCGKQMIPRQRPGCCQSSQGTLHFPCAGCRQLPFCGLAV